MTADHSKSYFVYLNKLEDEQSNIYHRSIVMKTIHADYSALPEEFESSHKTPRFKIGDDRVRITIYKNIFLANTTLENGQKKYLWLILYWKIILRCIKLKL